MRYSNESNEEPNKTPEKCAEQSKSIERAPRKPERTSDIYPNRYNKLKINKPLNLDINLIDSTQFQGLVSNRTKQQESQKVFKADANVTDSLHIRTIVKESVASSLCQNSQHMTLQDFLVSHDFAMHCAHYTNENDCDFFKENTFKKSYSENVEE